MLLPSSAIFRQLSSPLYTIAGRTDLAERLRPTVRRVEGLEEPAPGPAPIVDGGDPGPDADPTVS